MANQLHSVWAHDRRGRVSKRRLLGLGCAALLLGGCTTATTLVPAGSSQDGVAVVSKSGLELSAEVQAGSHTVPRSVTPIKISIKNLTPAGVYVALEDIQLEGEGFSSEAAPPESVTPRPAVGLGVDPASPFATAQGATTGAVVPPPGAAVPSPTPLAPAAAADKGTVLNPVKREIVTQAFEGGLIGSGETQEGLVYFTTPPSDVDHLRLRVRVRSSLGNSFQTLEIPYSVES
jgi:hypothetical protein